MRWIGLLLFVSVGASAGEWMKPAEKRLVLSAIDRICGDTWCEGEYTYEFPWMGCESTTASCEFRVVVVYEGRRTPHLCEVSPIRKLSDMVVRSGLTKSFYEKMTDCVSALAP